MKPGGEGSGGVSTGGKRARRAARRQWAVGLVVALVFHVTLAGLTRVQMAPGPREDHPNPRVTWVGDRAVLEEDTLQGQQLQIFNDAPLFLPTEVNFASRRQAADDSRPPGQIFSSFDPVLLVPVDRSPPGLVTAPTDRTDPTTAVQAFRWPVLKTFGREDSPERRLEPRRAHIEVRASDTGVVVLTESIPAANDPETPEVWPHWRPVELFVMVSQTGRLSQPLFVGVGSGSDEVDRFMQNYIRQRLRLALRVPPGSYRVLVGP